jgi:hypothetical protein
MVTELQDLYFDGNSSQLSTEIESVGKVTIYGQGQGEIVNPGAIVEAVCLGPLAPSGRADFLTDGRAA